MTIAIVGYTYRLRLDLAPIIDQREATMLDRHVVGLCGQTRLLLFSLLLLIAILPPGWAQTPPTVSRIAKIVPIADATGRRAYELVLNGANFAVGNKATDNILVLINYPQIVPCQSPTANDTTTVPPGCVTVQVRANGGEITYIGVPDDRAGDDQVTVWSGGSATAHDAFVTSLIQTNRSTLAI
jgi:hypothetical protein